MVCLNSEMEPEKHKRFACVVDRRRKWMPRRRTVEAEPTFYAALIAHSPHSEADHSEILVEGADCPVRSIVCLLSSLDESVSKGLTQICGL